jgi:hypothetical protein
MKQLIRYAIVLIVLASILFLARNPAAGATGPQSPALQGDEALVRGYVWNDVDRDGVQDAGENGIRNVTVRLYDRNRRRVAQVRTDQDGRYEFDGVRPGDYFVDIVTPSGYVISPRDQGTDEAVDSDTDPLSGETGLVTLVAGENLLMWDAGLSRAAQPPPRQNPGTVQPPPAEVTICQDGFASVGGISTLEVNNLAPGYCLAAFLRNRGFALGRIPDGAGQVLSNITFLRVFFNSNFVYEVAEGDGDVLVCYAIPAGREAQIYFFDFYGPRFGERTGQPEWEPLETTVENGVACAEARTSGAYALIGQ